jgi:putative ABC transport system ATP-binding protein
MSAIIEISDITKRYYEGTDNELSVLKNVTFNVEEGEFVAIVGPSGSGKSTLMNILGALDRPSEGSYRLDGVSIEDMNDNELSRIRNRKIGFVFQNFNLIPRTTALRNVELPLFYMGAKRGEREKTALRLLEMVEMGDRVDHFPNELSGGQKQRVAIARALANDPSIILADEPTGALDSKTGNLVMNIFKRINRDEKKTIILITHNGELATTSDRVITISDGEIVSDAVTGNGERRGWEAETKEAPL